MKKEKFDFRSIYSLEAALKRTGKTMPDFSFLPEDCRDRYQAMYEMETICEAVNDGWVPDWENTNQQKYRSWFWMSTSDFAFHCSLYDYDFSPVGGGSRLHLETCEKADYVGSHPEFLSIWKRIQLG